MSYCRRLFAFIIFFIGCVAAKAQDKPIGYWESHLPYNTALGVATDGSTVFAVCNQAFFSYNVSRNDMEPYSKVEGMSDIGMQCIAYDAATATTVLVYANGNIDLFKNNTFYNVPDLKIKSISGSKKVNQVYTENGMAYLSTSFGVLVVDLTNHSVSETYQFIANNKVIPVTGFIGAANYFYALSAKGLYRGGKNSPDLQNFGVWQNVDSVDTFISTASLNNTLFLATSKKVYTFINDTIKAVYTPANAIQHIDAGLSDLLVATGGPTGCTIHLMNTDYHVVDSFRCIFGVTSQAVQLADSSIWVAAPQGGLQKRIDSVCGYFYPYGPNDPDSYDIYVNNKNLWIAHGGYDGKLVAENNNSGVSNLNNDKWTDLNPYSFAPMANVTNIASIVKDEKDGTVYMGSFLDGLFILHADGTTQLVSGDVFDSSISYFGEGQRQVIGLALDQSDNLWVTTLYSTRQLYIKTAANVWHKFRVPGSTNGGPIIIDDAGQGWYACINGVSTNGVIVYNANGTLNLNDSASDASYHLTTGAGSGNLPSNNVFCLAKDKNNNIWIGTDNGIGIVSGCTSPFTQQTPPCDAEIPIVQYDQFAGYLFAGNIVRSIAVDGANRKWVGTDNGVWLLSPDASKIVYRFTQDNSPLPSNSIQKISIDKATGDVYIGTTAGLVVYRSTATDGGTTSSNVLVFPDPVPTGYSGTIAIKGLAANADVRITDINGQLVYRTTALGGQAVWNGVDYLGHRPQTGVYLIFVSSSDGSQTYAGKMVFMQ